MRASERGAALLEVLAAVAILGASGLGLVALAAEGARTVASGAIREAELADEERLLTALALLTHAELDLRLGVRETGPYLVEVQRPEGTLYRVAVRRREAPAREDLVTVLYAPEDDDAR